MSKQLKASLTLADVNVHEYTFSRTLNNTGVHGRAALFSDNHYSLLQFDQERVDEPEVHLKKNEF